VHDQFLSSPDLLNILNDMTQESNSSATTSVLGRLDASDHRGSMGCSRLEQIRIRSQP